MASSERQFLGVVTEDGKKLVLDDERGFRQAFAKFAADEVVVSIKRKPHASSWKQFKYLRGIVIPDIAEASGISDPDDYQDVFEGLAWKFLRLPDGPYGHPRRQSTSRGSMSRAELAVFIDKVITFAETSIPGCRVRRPEEIDLDRVVDPGWK